MSSLRMAPPVRSPSARGSKAIWNLDIVFVFSHRTP
jgi:hypothetical protein